MNPSFTQALASARIHALRGLDLLRSILRDAHTPTPSLPIDGSMLEECMRCPRASLFKHVFRRATSRPQPALDFGTAIHVGLELLAKGATLDEALASVESHYAAHPMPEEDYRHFGRAQEVLRGYVEEYPPSQEGWRIVETERPFSLVLGTIEEVLSVPLTILWEGKTDLLVQDPLGFWVVDHKTSSKFGEDSWDPYLAPNSSMLGYLWSVWRRTGVMPAGFIIDLIVVRKPSSRISAATPFVKGALPRTQYERRAFPVSRAHIQAWEQNTLAAIESWLTFAQRGFYPQYDRKGYNCAWCEFKQVCQQPEEKMALTLLSSGDYMPYTWSPVREAV